MKTCVLDIGSNSVRSALFDDGETVYKKLKTTHLGEGVVMSHLLKQDAMDRTVEAIAEFYEEAKREGAQEIYAFTTAAVRMAYNASDFLEAAKSACGVKIDVISSDLEAQLGLLGALGDEDGGIIDVGGASSEVIIRRDGEIIYSKSVEIGCVSLYDLAGRDFDRIDEVLDEKLEEYGDCDFVSSNVYAIGGTATNIASVVLGLVPYDPKKVDQVKIYAEEVIKMGHDMLAMSVDEVREIPGMDPSRAEVFGGACILLGRIMKKVNKLSAQVSDGDNLEGYYIYKEGRK